MLASSSTSSENEGSSAGAGAPGGTPANAGLRPPIVEGTAGRAALSVRSTKAVVKLPNSAVYAKKGFFHRFRLQNQQLPSSFRVAI